MKNCLFFLCCIISLLVIPVYAQNLIQTEKKDVDFPEVPRISAHEAYQQYKAGKAIIIHAGGESFEKRHIMGAHDVSAHKVVTKGEIPLPHFPMRGLDIYTYCY